MADMSLLVVQKPPSPPGFLSGSEFCEWSSLTSRQMGTITALILLMAGHPGVYLNASVITLLMQEMKDKFPSFQGADRLVGVG